MIRHLSFRYRVPLNLSLMALGMGLAIAGSVLWHDYGAVRADAEHSAAHLGNLLARALAHDLALEDTWQAYRTLRAVFQGEGETWLAPVFALALDPDGKTLVASDPIRFPLASAPLGLGEPLPRLLAAGEDPGDSRRIEARAGLSYRLVPIRAGENRIGTLLLAFSDERIWSRFVQSATQVLVATGLFLLVLLPFGWLLGRRLADPLSELESCVARLGEDPVRPFACPVQEGGNELGRLRARIEAVAEELREKRALERQVIRSERQAALGRLAAGVAHEINNPLGGMFTALATLKRHGGSPDVAAKTLSLLERGLDQIRHIVSALLVEVKAEPRDLVPEDIQDVARLLEPRVRAKRLHLAWPRPWEGPLALPAGPVRQVLMNLVLNAIQASPEQGAVTVAIEKRQGGLSIRVENDGEPIREERLERLFEPFSESAWGGTGLGLWITDQTVRQLRGRIQVSSLPGRTLFQVDLPLEERE